MSLRRSDFYRVLHRPNLILGGERELVMATGLLCAGIALTSLNLIFALVCLGLWVGALAVFRLMAKADPHLSAIYLRHLKYHDYYAARSRPSRIDR